MTNTDGPTYTGCGKRDKTVWSFKTKRFFIYYYKSELGGLASMMYKSEIGSPRCLAVVMGDGTQTRQKIVRNLCDKVTDRILDDFAQKMKKRVNVTDLRRRTRT